MDQTLNELFAAATAHHQAGDLEPALEAYGQILEREAEHAVTLVHVADLYLAYDREDDARLILASLLPLGEEKILADISGLPRAYLALAWLCLGADEDALADGILARAAEVWPDSLELQTAMAERLTDGGDVDGAERHYVRALELAPNRVELWSVLADLRLGKSDVSGAIDAWIEVLELAPGDSETVRLAIETVERLADDRAALQYLLALNDLVAEDADALIFIGIKFLSVEYFEGALSAFARAAEIDIASYEALFGAGAAAFRLGEDAAAAEYWRQGSSILPSDPEAGLNLIRTFAADLSRDVAVELIDRAATLVFEDANRLCVVAQVARDLGLDDEATLLIRRAIALEPENSYARGMLPNGEC